MVDSRAFVKQKGLKLHLLYAVEGVKHHRQELETDEWSQLICIFESVLFMNEPSNVIVFNLCTDRVCVCVK